MTLSTLLIVLLILLVVGAIPAWPYSRGYGYGPSGLFFIALLVLLFMVATGRAGQAQEIADVLVLDEPLISRDSIWSPVWEYAQPYVAMAATAIGLTIGGLALELLRRGLRRIGLLDAKTEAEIEAARAELDQRRNALLHGAAQNALAAAVAKRSGPIGNLVTSEIPKDLIDDAVAYVRRLNPEGAATVGDHSLREIVLSKAPAVQATITQGKTLEIIETAGTIAAAEQSLSGR